MSDNAVVLGGMVLAGFLCLLLTVGYVLDGCPPCECEADTRPTSAQYATLWACSINGHCVEYDAPPPAMLHASIVAESAELAKLVEEHRLLTPRKIYKFSDLDNMQ